MELYRFKESHKQYNSDNLKFWISVMFNIVIDCSIQCFHKAVKELSQKKTFLIKHKKIVELNRFLVDFFVSPVSNYNNTSVVDFESLSELVLDWEKNELKFLLNDSYKDIEKLMCELSLSHDKVDVLSDAIKEESNTKFQALDKAKEWKLKFADLKNEKNF